MAGSGEAEVGDRELLKTGDHAPRGSKVARLIEKALTELDR